MSFGGIKLPTSVVDMLALVLMLVAFYAAIQTEMSLSLKIGILVIAFAIFFLVTVASQALRRQKEIREEQMKG
jgi:large-conductance mechanosensitive channel